MKCLPKLLLILSSVCFVFGCKKNNDLPANSIVGNWFQTTDTIKQYQNGVLTSSIGSQTTISSVWQFEKKGVLNSYDNGVINAVPATYKVTADSLVIYVPAQNLNGIPQQVRTINWQIQTLTQHELILASTANTFTDINLQQTIPLKIVTLYYLSR
jgi:hypothetical protein